MKIDSLKSYIFVATTAMGIVLYMNSTYATSKRVSKIELEQTIQIKVSCLIAVEVGIEKKKLSKICKFEL